MDAELIEQARKFWPHDYKAIWRLVRDHHTQCKYMQGARTKASVLGFNRCEKRAHLHDFCPEHGGLTINLAVQKLCDEFRKTQ
jgi:hypothetical protein